MIRLALFDIDGTLVRTGGAGMLAFEKTFQTVFGVPAATRGVHFAGRTDTALVRECLRNAGVRATRSNFQKFFDTYVFWLQELLGELQGAACPGVAPFIQQLASLPEPPRIGLLTGNIRLGAELKLRHFGLWGFFLCGAFGDDHEDRNRLAEIAKEQGETAWGRKLDGSEVLVIGDTPLDIACAGSIGARMLAVATGAFTEGELAAHRPTWCVPSLESLDAAKICGPG